MTGTPGVRRRLLTITLSVVGIVGVATAVWLETSITDWLLPHERDAHLQRARAVAEALRDVDLEALPERTEALASALDHRITLVGADRRVVLDTDGDSAGTEVASLEGSSDGVFVVPGNDGDQWVA
ncbi:MAG: hypothetical protein ACI9WU_003122, partial [Myxococcota bacterium]